MNLGEFCVTAVWLGESLQPDLRVLSSAEALMLNVPPLASGEATLCAATCRRLWRCPTFSFDEAQGCKWDVGCPNVVDLIAFVP